MSIKRMATTVCDGPCGTKINGEHVPEGWANVRILKYEQLEPKQKPSYIAKADLCPKCHDVLLKAFSAIHFNLNLGFQAKEKKSEEVPA